MAILNSWQRIDRVIPGLPFGNGSDGAYSSATIPTLTKDSCSGTATSTTLTTAGSTFANGDLLLIHQTRGTGAGQWEINKVASGGGSTSLTLSKALYYTYTDSGASQAQATKIPQYTDVTVQSGTWTLSAWGGNTGGILTFASNGTLTVTGAISANSKGYLGGAAGQDPAAGDAGEGASGNPGSAATGAGQATGVVHGAGGGYGTAGTGGSNNQTPGAQYGSADLTVLTLGGGGAGGSANPSTSASAGAPAGGGVIIFTKSITIAGSITSTGGTAANGADRSGGGGAGGPILIVAGDATLGTTKITAVGGSGGTSGADSGGNGGVGRIAVHHSGTVTGTTNPTFTDVEDTTLVESLSQQPNYVYYG